MSNCVTLQKLQEDSDTLIRTKGMTADSWCLWLWNDIMEVAIVPPLPVEVDDDVFYDNPTDEDVTLAVVRAGDLKGEHFWLHGWHPDRIAHGKRIESFVESMHDDTLILASFN